MIRLIKNMVARDRDASCDRCYQWGGELVARLRPQSLLDVGCADGAFLFKYLDYRPALFCGLEANPSQRKKAEERGIKAVGADLNGVWPFESEMFDVIHCAQVIEHLHNTRLFVSEMHRVLKPGGTAVVASENLTSFLNTAAMLLGYTPFTLMRVCGWYLGNPLGLHYGEIDEEGVPITDPAFAGVTGHIRALSVLQAQELFTRIGFQAKVRSIGLMPIPEFIGKHIEHFMPRRGHFLIIEARKPEISAQNSEQ